MTLSAKWHAKRSLKFFAHSSHQHLRKSTGKTSIDQKKPTQPCNPFAEGRDVSLPSCRCRIGPNTCMLLVSDSWIYMFLGFKPLHPELPGTCMGHIGSCSHEPVQEQTMRFLSTHVARTSQTRHAINANIMNSTSIPCCYSDLFWLHLNAPKQHASWEG